VGAAQTTWRPDGSAEPLVDGLAPEPLEMWESVARRAADDSGATGILDVVDSLHVVYTQSWPYDDPPLRLAECLAIEPRQRVYSGIGGTTPQVLVDDAARTILAGDTDVALLVGAEALATKRRLKKAGERPLWSHRDPHPPPFPFEAPFHDAEVAHEVFQAWATFPLWDVARRAHLAVDPDDYRQMLGEVMAPMTAVAAKNPFAWFPVERTVDELITATPENRLVGYPYTKYMVSVMEVDMAAALILCSHEAADRLGVPADRRVYLRGFAYATDPVYVAEHEPMWSSPAMAACFRSALHQAGTGIDDVAHLDLYSCFGSSLTFARDALGLESADPRSMTVTGGLPFAGGAGSNYVMHSIAAMADVLRGDPGSLGMISGVGMHMTKHVAAVYSTEPASLAPPDEAAIQAELDRGARREIVAQHSGPARVAAYTVAHGRDGEPEWGLAVCDLADGRRAYARVADPHLLDAIEREEWVGTDVVLEPEDSPMGPRNLVHP
jgi:acetyl-CoA C-acetyltransferase